MSQTSINGGHTYRTYEWSANAASYLDPKLPDLQLRIACALERIAIALEHATAPLLPGAKPAHRKVTRKR